MGIFKSYDIRAVYGKEWDAETVYRIGFCLPRLLEAREILIGRDARLSSDEIRAALIRGITDAGCHVADIGLCSTPTIYFSTAYYQFDGSVMITASHNPPEYNGLKISRKDAVPVGYDTGLARLEEMVRQTPAPGASRGEVRIKDIRSDYLAHLSRFSEGIRGIKAVIDCSDGMAGVVVHEVMGKLDARISTIFDKPDGTFPHHDPNPLVEENLAQLKLRVKEEGADLGICFDGDADRVMFVDDEGRFVSPDLITALLCTHYFRHFPERRGASDVVLYDVRSSRSVVEEIERLGGKPRMCQVGHSFAKRLLRQTDGIMGGELAGHYYFKENYYCDSGMIAALLVLSVLSKDGITIRECVRRIQRYFFSGEINFRVENKEAIIEKLRGDYGEGTLSDIDGIRIDYPTWWFNVRPSNTEPYLRLVVEASSREELDARTAELSEKIRSEERGRTS